MICWMSLLAHFLRRYTQQHQGHYKNCTHNLATVTSYPCMINNTSDLVYEFPRPVAVICMGGKWRKKIMKYWSFHTPQNQHWCGVCKHSCLSLHHFMNLTTAKGVGNPHTKNMRFCWPRMGELWLLPSWGRIFCSDFDIGRYILENVPIEVPNISLEITQNKQQNGTQTTSTGERKKL